MSLAADQVEDYELTYPLPPLTIADLLGVPRRRSRSELPARVPSGIRCAGRCLAGRTGAS